MELFGIFFSIPVAFAASMLYCLFLAKFVSKFVRLSNWLRAASVLILGLFAVEILLLISLGAVRSRGLLGPGFYVAHLVFFFLCTPALANVLILRPARGGLSTWYVAGFLCTLFAFLLVLLQYGVSESLYGINGDDGPYSHNSAPFALRELAVCSTSDCIGVKKPTQIRDSEVKAYLPSDDSDQNNRKILCPSFSRTTQPSPTASAAAARQSAAL
jgi:hypothetical protein